MKAPNNILIISLFISLIALGATSYFYVQATKNHERTMSYLNAVQEKEEWTRAREELQENNRQLRAALQKKIHCKQTEPKLQIVPDALTTVEDNLSVPAEIMEVRPFHIRDKTNRLLSRSRVDILENNINRLKKAQRQNTALDRIDKHIRNLESRMHLLNPSTRYRWTYDQEPS